MRFWDYRSSDGNGIALLLAAPLPNARLYKLALGRVGRNGDPCKRYQLGPHIDDAEASHKEKLSRNRVKELVSRS